ncbi:MAG: gliding motility protein GldC [Saprospiraceae bacterium]|nr:gliding motility protein GldC [Saprospiraceae bacterium]
MAKEKVVKKSKIQIEVGLNDEQMPVAMRWSSSDGPDAGKSRPCKAMLLGMFDAENKETLRIDLWTKDMQVIEMDRFFFQTLKSMADTYFKATQNAELATAMQQYVHYFGEKTEIIPK